MTSRRWSVHLARLLLAAAITVFFGWAIGYPGQTVTIAVAALIAWQFYNQWRLLHWLRDQQQEIPRTKGLWGEIYGDIDAMASRSRQQKERITAIVDEFRGLADAFPDATLVIDRGNAVTWFNLAAKKLLGLEDPDDLGRPVTNVVQGQAFAEWLQVQKDLSSPLEMPSPRGDRRWLTVNAVPFRSGQRLMVLRDTTDIHRLEKIRRDFVANISHELRTPLTVVQGYLEMLEYLPAEEISDTAGKMLEQTAQMQVLLGDLLELSRLQDGELQSNEEVIDVPALVSRLEEQAQHLSQGRHQLEFEIEPGLHLAGYATDLDSAFNNLIANAIKYTPAGGDIRVSWKNGLGGPEFTVSDNGIGIPARDIPRLTERFYRVGSDRARDSGGTGLGLAIVKHVLKAHQADLLVESQPGSGSTFTCRFPEKRARSAG